MFCRYCGNEVEDDWKCCPKCGKNTGEIANEKENNPKKEEPKDYRLRALLITFCFSIFMSLLNYNKPNMALIFLFLALIIISYTRYLYSKNQYVNVFFWGFIIMVLATIISLIIMYIFITYTCMIMWEACELKYCN